MTPLEASIALQGYATTEPITTRLFGSDEQGYGNQLGDDMIQLAILIATATSGAWYADNHSAHINGMAELISHTTGRSYKAVRFAIVDGMEAQ
jgi:hypothetical protein